VSLADVPVEDDERLARIIMLKKQVWEKEGRFFAEPEAFLPYSRRELSVIRHRDLTEDELWNIGRDVAAMREAGDKFGRKFPLIGRGDFLARDARTQNLDVKPVEGVGLPRNHADVVGWPSDKAAQLLHAEELAARAVFVAAPTPKPSAA
jgi:hypothetical protein